jgi:hypothetical protein
LRYEILVRIFKNTWFTRFARKEGIADDELRDIVNQLEAGKWDANLGAGVYKQRISRPGEGKSGGYRVIVFFKSEFRTMFVYGFAKSDQANIGKGDLKALKIEAKYPFALNDEQIKALLGNGTLLEVL